MFILWNQEKTHTLLNSASVTQVNSMCEKACSSALSLTGSVEGTGSPLAFSVFENTEKTV